MTALVNYIQANGIYWTYWMWTPDSNDTGGILANDWTGVNQDKLNLLGPLM